MVELGSRYHRWCIATMVMVIGRGFCAMLPVLGESPAEQLESLVIEIEMPRALSEAARVFSHRHGVVMSYEDPRWAHESDVFRQSTGETDVSGRLADEGPPETVLRLRPKELRFEYKWSDFAGGATSVLSLLERMIHESSNDYEVREGDGMLHLVPRQSLDENGTLVPHVSPLDVPIYLPHAERTIRDTILSVLEAASEVSDVPVRPGLLMIGVRRRTVEMGSNGRTAREVLVEAFKADDRNISWVLFYGPEERSYFLSLYIVGGGSISPPGEGDE